MLVPNNNRKSKHDRLEAAKKEFLLAKQVYYLACAKFAKSFANHSLLHEEEYDSMRIVYYSPEGIKPVKIKDHLAESFRGPVSEFKDYEALKDICINKPPIPEPGKTLEEEIGTPSKNNIADLLKELKNKKHKKIKDGQPRHHCGNPLTDKEIFYGHCLKCEAEWIGE